jgi:hypothetical protein
MSILDCLNFLAIVNNAAFGHHFWEEVINGVGTNKEETDLDLRKESGPKLRERNDEKRQTKILWYEKHLNQGNQKNLHFE